VGITLTWYNASISIGARGMLLCLIDDGSGIDYITNITLALTLRPQEVKLTPFAEVNAPFENRLESLQLFPLVNADHDLALLTLYATDFTAIDTTTNMLGRPLGKIPSPLKLAINVSILGLVSDQDLYAVNMTTMSVLAGPLTPVRGMVNLSVKVGIPEEASPLIGPKHLLDAISELSLSGPKEVVVGHRVNFTLYQKSPFGSASLTNATLIVNGTAYPQGDVVINESGNYVTYAIWNGKRSNEVTFTVGTQAFFVASELWWLPLPVAIAVIVTFVYISRKKARQIVEGH